MSAVAPNLAPPWLVTSMAILRPGSMGGPDGVRRTLTLSTVFRRQDRELRRRLRRLPVLILDRVSRETAAVVAGDLAAQRCELTVSDRLPRSLRLPWTFAGLATLALMLLLPLGGWESRTSGFLGVLGVEILIGAMYLVKTRPLISFRALGRGRPTGRDELGIEVAQCVRALRSLDVKVIVGHIARACLALERRDENATPGCEIDPPRVARQAFAAAGLVDRFQVYLRERSLNEIKAKLDTVTLRVARLTDAAELAPLIAAQASLRLELDRYRTIQDRHSQLRVALLNLSSVLQQFEDAVAAGSTRPDMAEVLARIARGLQGSPIDSGDTVAETLRPAIAQPASGSDELPP